MLFPQPQPRGILTPDLQWPFVRHAEVFAGVQRCAEERRWVTILNEFAQDTLRRKCGAGRHDGVVTRADHPMARHAAKFGVPVVNLLSSSPARR
jgi:hypothetical protein